LNFVQYILALECEIMTISKKRELLLLELQQEIGYSFKNNELNNEALTHSSYANETKNKRIGHNERLEFLGDSVLSLIVSDYIFTKFKSLPEGELTKVRANVVCEPALAAKAKAINLGKYLLLGKGEELTGGRTRNSILADAFEALLGAMYIDGGLEVVRSFVLIRMTDVMELACSGSFFKDYKTQLQELLQSKTTDKIVYQVVKESGPDHDKTFCVEVSVNGEVLGSGEGKSKKLAEQSAAQFAIEKVRKLYDK